ncbi:CoA-binding protein [Sphingobacterium sp. SG20118]|uniref:CoA-binding protein n=1 Tax=Sphingobacterium TaxID=28453 RepID=UPI0004F6DBBE|nr:MULTISPECIES: CoA-binding protein [Sphingobacterium]AIM35631.1 CoA-binding protein [Sphingobacterium sp. ML3W]MDH5828246.1 CoA-binding protein [Sphingobacterium faecium]
MKKTLIIGASTNPDRYSYKAALKLRKYGHDIVNIGLKKGEVAGVEIEKIGDIHQDIDTITLYVSANNQKSFYDYILATNPKRIIFNPGTENPELVGLAEKLGILTDNSCTLVLLSTGQY